MGERISYCSNFSFWEFENCSSGTYCKKSAHYLVILKSNNSMHKNNPPENDYMPLEICAIINSLILRGETAVKIYEMLMKTYREYTDASSMHHWAKQSHNIKFIPKMIKVNVKFGTICPHNDTKTWSTFKNS